MGAAYHKKSQCHDISHSKLQKITKNHQYVLERWKFLNTSIDLRQNFASEQPMVDSEVCHSIFF